MARMFVPDRSFLPSLMFVGKDRIPPLIGEPKSALLGQALVLLTNIRLGFKGLHWSNALALLIFENCGLKKFYNFTWVSSSLGHKHQTRLERPARDKHSSLFGLFVSYNENEEFGLIFTGKAGAYPSGEPDGTSLAGKYKTRSTMTRSNKQYTPKL